MDATSDAPRSPSEQAPTDDAAGRGDAPRESGPVRIVCWSPSGVAESTDLDALAATGRQARHPPLGRPDRPHRADRPGRRADAQAAPADRRRHRGAERAGEGRGLRRHGPCRAVRRRVPRRGPAHGGRPRARQAVPALGPRLGDRPREARDDARRRRRRPRERHRLPALHDRRPDRRRLLPDDGQAGRRDRRPPGPGRRIAERVDAPEGLRDEEGAPLDPASDLAGPGGASTS